MSFLQQYTPDKKDKEMIPALVIPIVILGVHRLPNGLGLGFLEDIVASRELLKRNKNVYYAIFAVADESGSKSPLERQPDLVLKETDGFSLAEIQYVVNLKKQSQHLIPEDDYTVENVLIGVIMHSFQPGMVIVDMMKKGDEERTLQALQFAAQLGCSLILPLPRPDAYKTKCLQFFGKERLLTFKKPPSARRLVFALQESYDLNPLKDTALPVEYNHVQLRQQHHGEGCNHGPHDEHDGHAGHGHYQQEAHVHSNACSHGEGGHGHSHAGHSHGRHQQGAHVHSDAYSHGHDLHGVDEISTKVSEMSVHKRTASSQSTQESALKPAMNELTTDPNLLTAEIKKNNFLYIHAAVRLSAYADDLPEEYSTKLASLNTTYSKSYPSFAGYFGSADNISLLLQNVKDIVSNSFLESRSMLAYLSLLLQVVVLPGEVGSEIRSDFVRLGGIEMLRLPCENGVGGTGGGLRSPEYRIRGLANEIFTQLAANSCLLLQCDLCGKREEMMKEWKKCSKCLFNVYCSRECQVGDWKVHKRFCGVIG